MTSVAPHLLELIQAALDDADDPSVPASSLLRKAIRIARLRDDWEAVWWLRLQSFNPRDQRAEYEGLRGELSAHIPADEWESTSARVIDRWMSMRSRRDGMVQAMGLAELESHAQGIATRVRGLPDAPVELDMAVMEFEGILSRIRDAIAIYVGDAEREVRAGFLKSDVFQRNRDFVEAELAHFAPQVLAQLRAAHDRRDQDEPEAFTHALTSCRRALKSLADVLYPANDEEIIGADGRSRTMSDDRFINRLCQFATESASGASRVLTVEHLVAIGDRLKSLVSLGSKGVHADVSADEVDLTITHTYTVIGDLLRMRCVEQT